MTTMQLIFLISAAVTLVAAFMVVFSPQLVHSALWLILALAGIAVFFVLLNAGFLAVVQVAVYIDAIAVLIIIVVMLTQKSMSESMVQVNRSWWFAALAALVMFGGLLALFNLTPLLDAQAPTLTSTAESLLEDLGKSLVDIDRFILPFELASILLLAAMVGSIMIAWPRGTGVDEEGEA
ncbi:MAG: NADH-quinone oxidoreductase subunit J [Anaerolineales bacterium]|nr:NADH-quinone oxidoreductase subunit J [Anaerolineales bacterium]